MEERNFKKYFFWALVGILVVISYFIIKDFIVSILSAFILSYLLLPIHRALSRKINKKLSAFLLIILIALLYLGVIGKIMMPIVRILSVVLLGGIS